MNPLSSPERKSHPERALMSSVNLVTYQFLPPRILVRNLCLNHCMRETSIMHFAMAFCVSNCLRLTIDEQSETCGLHTGIGSLVALAKTKGVGFSRQILLCIVRRSVTFTAPGAHRRRNWV